MKLPWKQLHVPHMFDEINECANFRRENLVWNGMDFGMVEHKVDSDRIVSDAKEGRMCPFEIFEWLSTFTRTYGDISYRI